MIFKAIAILAYQTNIVMLGMKMLVALHSLLKFSHLSLEHDFESIHIQTPSTFKPLQKKHFSFSTTSTNNPRPPPKKYEENGDPFPSPKKNTTPFFHASKFHPLPRYRKVMRSLHNWSQVALDTVWDTTMMGLWGPNKWPKNRWVAGGFFHPLPVKL